MISLTVPSAPLRNSTRKPASSPITNVRPWYTLSSAAAPFCTTAIARPGIFHSVIASATSASSSVTKSVIGALGATDEGDMGGFLLGHRSSWVIEAPVAAAIGMLVLEQFPLVSLL